MALDNTSDRIFSRARDACEERNPESRGSAGFGPSPSSSPLQGEGKQREGPHHLLLYRERGQETSPLSSAVQGKGTAWAPRSVGVGIVAIYRAAISPVIHALNGPACRFEPSCSEYAREAIAGHGMVRGGAMAIWRIARCNPMGGHGFDPVPARADGIVNRAGEVHPHPRSGAASPANERARRVISGAERDMLTRPSPSSSPLQGEGTENCAELSSRGEVTAKTAVSFSPFAGEETA